MIISAKLISLALLLVAEIVQSKGKDEKSPKINNDEILKNSELDDRSIQKPLFHKRVRVIRNQKYSSRIAENRTWTENVFGIRSFPIGKTNTINDYGKTKHKVNSSTEKVLDFRIIRKNDNINKTKQKEAEEGKKKFDLATASAGNGKKKKEADDEDEKTLAQQVADGKYGLIQNEIFANGSRRPGIISYSSNTEVPKDTKENLGGLDKDEIWLAEDHILVLRGGGYQDIKENETPPSSVWPPIDNYKAPLRQVKIPKNPDIPPPFPVQLSEDGPVEFVKGQKGLHPIPPVIPPLPPFAQEGNKTLPFPFPLPNPLPPDLPNKTLPFPIPPHLPPFLSNLPPGATFVAPPDNHTEIDEDDPSIYYPPKYDFFYPQDNTTAVPPGPLVPGIILPPPPDFFSLLENDTDYSNDSRNETDDSLNSITPKPFMGPKYLPTIRKPTRPRVSTNRQLKRPTSVTKLPESNSISKSLPNIDAPGISYIYPDYPKQKYTPTTSTQNKFRTSAPIKHVNNLFSPVFVPSNSNRSSYQNPLPTTSPKPNHITLPTTKTLPKQILIITTPETVDKSRTEEVFKKSKPDLDVIQKYEYLNPKNHPLKSLIKPNVTVSYNGKYGHLPPAATFPQVTLKDDEGKTIRGHYVTQSPSVTKETKSTSTDINSITVTPVPVVKKIRVHPIVPEKTEVITPTFNPSKATFYFYEEPSTTEIPAPVQVPQKPEGTPDIEVNTELKNEPKPVTQYYYTKSTIRTPIRQFLEETFHASNVLARKPQLGHINNAEIITHYGYSDVPKMKHLNYAAPVSSKPLIKYHYVTENPPIVIPNPTIKDLEIKNSGSSGLQKVNLENVVVRQAPTPLAQQEKLFEPTPKPLENPPESIYVATPTPSVHQTTEEPFVPSNYYATVRPEHFHITSQEQTLVDDITKNYFTIFGQKINSGATTPIAPVKSVSSKSKTKPESGLTYISDDGHNFKIQQIHETSSGRIPGKSSAVLYTNENPKPKTRPRPPSNFEKYLKELTGEDQRDYIVSGVFPAKIKKGKGFLAQPPILDGIPPHLLSQGPIIFQNEQPQMSPLKNPTQAVSKPVPFQPNFSTTLRPVIDVEIKPQYVQHISSTSKPFDVYRSSVPPQNVQFPHNFQQYIQEITGLTSPTTTRPVKIKKPNVGYHPSGDSPLNPVGYQPPFQVPGTNPKPVSLEGDILVNYKQPRPSINPDAELINVPNTNLPFDVSPNIKIVDSPDLSRNPNEPYPTKQITFGVATKDLFENLPKTGYFSTPHQAGGNSFVSYNLPGNGGHFYFLTPQIVHKDNDDTPRQDKDYKRVNRNDNGSNRYSSDSESGGFSSPIEHNIDDGYSNHDYLRRRRKKP